MRKQTNKAVWTLIDLWIGIFLYFILLEIIGFIFVPNRITYTLGLLTGCVTAGFLAWHMYDSLDTALDMGEADAVKHSKKSSALRLLVMLVVALAGMKLSLLSFPGIIIGILGLKISAFFQPYTNLYITKKILKKKGR
jgi:hypothetical protein